MLKTGLRTVPDTNILLAAEMSGGPTSPNVEYFDRWESGEFTILFSQDTFLEYALKLREKNIPDERIKQVLRALLQLGIEVFIEHYHLPVYPVDTDDIAFLLCADNGEATHLVSYDKHLLDVGRYYPFKVCGPIDFLKDLRRALPPAIPDAAPRTDV